MQGGLEPGGGQAKAAGTVRERLCGRRRGEGARRVAPAVLEELGHLDPCQRGDGSAPERQVAPRVERVVRAA
jgi:hypothetical protein